MLRSGRFPSTYTAAIRIFLYFGVFGAATFVSNFLFFHDEALYFDEADSALNPLFHVWSLAVEEQFYIFFPDVSAVF